MKRIHLAAAIAALMLAGPAFADGHGHGKGHGKSHGDHDRVVMRHDRDDDRYDRYERRDWKAEGRHDNGLHRGQYKHWARGERLPRTYVVQRYYVQDYRDYGLGAPPPGLVWVRPYEQDRTFYLVQVATGLISQIFGR
ncbi:RcnB family protein [Cognatilysobacter segetis]|uniref:RcnB family protein n=1 Tax=Cognatilysobacter segetis TaxID=2492394 RepID=UPI0010621944|nr:RcnB family protein [Lysobacter segetis]